MFFLPYVAEVNGYEFNVVGVWTTPKDYRQAHLGFARFHDWMKERDTIVLGDFNNNGSYGGGRPWGELMELIEPLNLVSAYHAATGEPFGKESVPTYYHQTKRERGWHVDYCFVPRSWDLRSVQVGDFEKWSDYSDHMPLIVEADPHA